VQKSNLRIIDGMHRLEATRLRGEATIRARLVDCTDKEAFVLAVKSNTLHGLPLARADRIAGAKRILAWHPDWSDRAIGVATGLSAKTIAGIRRRSPEGVQQFAKRLGRDGKRHPLVNTEGRRRAADYIAARPEASLREVAREADVSLGTVHDVRARMRQGLDPIAGGRREASAEPAPSLANQPAPGRRAAPGVPAPKPRRHAPPPRTWSIVSAKLANDPSFKYTEDGRNFIRWMTAHIVRGEEWRDFLDTIPAHWLDEMSMVAENASTEWRAFAEHLKRRHNRAAV
jgi:ParB-like chromosome segregation protein Spo0J